MKIIVSTDFSPTADNAVNYAAHLASACGAAITQLHIITPPMSSPGYHGVADDERIQTMNRAIERLKSDSERLSKQFPGLKINYVLHEGDTPEAIVQKGISESCDFMVMGTIGSSGLIKTIFGSNTMSVIEQGDFPVLAVPPSAKANPPQTLVFATDYRFSDLPAIDLLIELARALKANLEIVHIISGSEEESVEKETIAAFRERVMAYTDYGKIEFQIFRNTKPGEGLRDYSASKKIDLIALAKRKRSKVQQFLDRGVTHQLLQKPELPMMIFHATDDWEGDDF
jgi:nucleotide-binding universal stress UspA family protein